MTRYIESLVAQYSTDCETWSDSPEPVPGAPLFTRSMTAYSDGSIYFSAPVPMTEPIASSVRVNTIYISGRPIADVARSMADAISAEKSEPDFIIRESGHPSPRTTAETARKIRSLSPELQAELDRLATVNSDAVLALGAQVKRLSILAGLEIPPLGEDTEA